MKARAFADDRQLTEQLEALADPVRRRILGLLQRRGCCSCIGVGRSNAGLCICDLQAKLKLSQPTITHHIQKLRKAGFVATQKIGRWVYCCRNENALVRLQMLLRKL